MARSSEAEVQAARATARFIRISPTKARQVTDLIRGRHVDDARRVLQFTQRAAATPVAKVLESAVANAEHNRDLPGDELVVTKTWVDEGPTMRRFRPRAMGRATRVRKRTCHISVEVGRVEQELPRPTATPQHRGAAGSTESPRPTPATGDKSLRRRRPQPEGNE